MAEVQLQKSIARKANDTHQAGVIPMSAPNGDTANDDLHFTGIVRGRSIELEQSVPFDDGQRVVVILAACEQSETKMPPAVHEGLLKSLGGWADAGPGFDVWLAEVYAARNVVRPIDLP